MTLTEQIFTNHINKEVKANDIVDCPIDMVIGNDITTPISIKQFEKSKAKKLANPDGFAIVLDHYIPAKDILSANQAKISRDFAKKHNLKYLFDEKNMGIEHALLPENGLISPGDVIIGADSHTCTHGALGAFATGMGSTDLAYAMITGKNWFKIPSAIKVVFRGKLNKFVYGKDLILEIIRILGVDGALYKSLEFFGIEELDMDSRFSLCNMAIEAGAKNGICAVDDITKDFLKNINLKRKMVEVKADENAKYERILEIDLDKLSPVVAHPFLPSNVKSIEQTANMKIKIDQAFIGSCTNGRLSDLRIAADILKGKKIHKDVRMIITPATTKIALQAQKEGLMDIFADAGCVVSNPTCGACLGGYMGILADNEVCVSTTNRNFIGRMGARSSKVYLSNSAVSAASAIKGYICSPNDL